MIEKPNNPLFDSTFGMVKTIVESKFPVGMFSGYCIQFQENHKETCMGCDFEKGCKKAGQVMELVAMTALMTKPDSLENMMKNFRFFDNEISKILEESNDSSQC